MIFENYRFNYFGFDFFIPFVCVEMWKNRNKRTETIGGGASWKFMSKAGFFLIKNFCGLMMASEDFKQASKILTHREKRYCIEVQKKLSTKDLYIF